METGKDNTNNKEYWEEYVNYWVHRVEETNDGKSDDKTMSDIVQGKCFDRLDVTPEDIFLDFGCGFCRIYPRYQTKTSGGRNYYGLDIAQAPLKIAETAYPELKTGRQLFVFDGEKMPFETQMFDKIFCFGVFDACRQEQIIMQLIDRLKLGGRLLITGKNNCYYENDEAALTAEINARKKGHPNYFTDIHKLVKYLEAMGVSITDSNYFLRRGDFAEMKYVEEMPDVFYEWMLLLQRERFADEIDVIPEFSDKYSETFKKLGR